MTLSELREALKSLSISQRDSIITSMEVAIMVADDDPRPLGNGPAMHRGQAAWDALTRAMETETCDVSETMERK
jgi:hypothetical protein